jgi:hypothetical protein
LNGTIVVLSIIMVLYHFVYVKVLIQPPDLHANTHLGFGLVLTYLLAVSPTAVPVSFYGVAFVQEETGGTWERTAWVQVFPLRLYLPFVRRGW